MAEQLKLARATGTSKNGSKVPKNFGSKHKEVSSHDLREFEELSYKVEKRLSKMGLSSSASAAGADESMSSEESDDDSSSTERSSRKKRENRTLAGLHKKTKEQKRPAPLSSNPVLFCSDYQKGLCSHSKDHYAMLKGEKKWLCHICAACWVKDKAKRMHSEYADDCPNKPKE